MTIRAGIVRDERYLDHKTGHIHPDHPNRLKAVYRMLDMDFPDGLIYIEAEPASLEYLEFVHTPIYIEKVLKTSEHNFTNLAPDTPASAMTYLAAWMAAGGCIKGVDALVSGSCDVCFSLVRPPGHHALPDRACGFCIFNNLGIAARYAVNHHGFKRILIIDWDIHHGNGLQEIFYGEENILYFSSHDPLLYPFTGGWEETGTGKGEGYTVNLPIPRELKEGEFLYLYQEILVPMIMNYRPDLILVSAGFDAHHKDPIGKSHMTEHLFGSLTELLLNLRLAAGKPPILFSLEGGYHPRSLAMSVKSVLDAIMEKKRMKKISVTQTDLSSQLIEKIKNIHSKYKIWSVQQ